MIQPYNVACIQTTIRQVQDPATRDEAIRENLYRGISLMEYASIRFGQPKLVVLPEFYLTSTVPSKSNHRAMDKSRCSPCRSRDRRVGQSGAAIQNVHRRRHHGIRSRVAGSLVQQRLYHRTQR